MINKIYITLFAVFIFAFALTSSVNAMYTGYTGGPTHGWQNQPIRMEWNHGGPNILIKETVGLTVSQISSRDNYNAFGYYTFDGNTGQILTENAINFDSNGQAYIGEFEQGTYIGTWISTDEGKYYSNENLNQGPSKYRVGYLGDTPEGNLTLGLDGLGASIDYGDLNVAFEPTDQAHAPGDHAPAGQPLPGILISALIGLGITGIAGTRKHKSR